MVRLTDLLFIPLLSWTSVVAATYSLVEDLTTADSFWRGFDFFTGADPTNGHVEFINQSQANSTGLAGTVFTSDGLAIYLGADHNSTTPQGRPSIRLTSKNTHNHALWIMDVAHAPVAPGAWPAIWLLGTSTRAPYGPWPDAGEVDIYEQINNASSNRMTLHTRTGVTIGNDTSAMANGSSILTANCDVNAVGQSKNQGCAIDQPAGTFGDAFNQNGGGVFATEYTSQAIKIWFFPRTNLPTGVDFNSPSSTANWPKPNALFTGNNVNYDDFFCDMQVVIDLTFCGDWAGQQWAASGNTNLAPTCEDYVSNHPEGFQEAYWKIYGIKVFEDQSNNSYPDTSSSNSTATSIPSIPSTSSTSSNSTVHTYDRRVPVRKVW